MSSRTVRAMTQLRFLVKYLLGARGNAIRTAKSIPGQGVLGAYEESVAFVSMSVDWSEGNQEINFLKHGTF